ncbi:hypothetical protein PWT90_04253 [Aphanocladium album]|nr:hypothetical protein PWT90_04253 [Aphanocladium album]
MPNFFLEAEAPRGGADVAKRQPCSDGAIGARAMLNLQNYGKDEPVYDRNAQTFSSTYHDSTLKMDAHHVTAPAAEGERREYHITQLRTFDLARRQRESLFRVANTKALSEQQQPLTVKSSVELHNDNVVHGHLEHSEIAAWQDFHDDLQQHITNTHSEVNEDDGDAPTTPRQQHSTNESHDYGQDSAALGADNASMSCVSSFTAIFSTKSARPKRYRQSFGSPTQETDGGTAGGNN